MYKFVLTNRGKTFVFDFSFESRGELLSDQSSSCQYVKYNLYRTDEADKVWSWQGSLCIDQWEGYQLFYPDKIDIKGKLTLYRENGNDFIFLDTYYGYELEEHFEGNIMMIPDDLPVDPDRPVKPDIPINPIDDLPIISNDYLDLFPYLYIKPWIGGSGDEEYYFMNYTQLSASPPISNFYENLLQYFPNGQAVTGARKSILEQAYNFINEQSPYEGQYLSDIQELPFPYNLFPGLYNEIQLQAATGHTQLETLILKADIDLEKLVNSGEYLAVKDRLWQNVFALSIVNVYNEKGLESYIKALLVFHILDNVHGNKEDWEIEELEYLIHASIVLPEPVFPLPPFNSDVPGSNQQDGIVLPYAIGDLQMVQHKLIGYKSGEVARIENVLPGEIKETNSSSFEELEESSVSLDENHTETTDNWSGNIKVLQDEIQSTLAENNDQTNDYNNLTTSYGPPTTGTYGGSVEFKNTHSRNNANTEVQFAKEVLNKTVSRMIDKLSVYQQKKQLSRKEEAVHHTLDNRGGTQAIHGVYAWVNKIYGARVVNYGNRFLLEFLIDKPSLENGEERLEEKGIIAPSELSKPINSFKDITLNNYNSLAAEYGVTDVPLPPPQQKTVYIYFNSEKALTGQMLNIPEAYVPSIVNVSYQVNDELNLLVGAKLLQLSPSTNSTPTTNIESCKESLQDLYEPDCNVTSIPVVLNLPFMSSPPVEASEYFLTVEVRCVPSLSLMDKWRSAVYDAIMEAYEQNKADALKQLAKAPAINKQIPRKWVNRQVMDRCMEVLYKIHLAKSTPLNPVLSPPATEVNKPMYYEFFTLGMEWKEATYSFSETETDTIQQRVAQSLAAYEYGKSIVSYLGADRLRVMVPVRPNYNYRLLYYLQTGLVVHITDNITPVFNKSEYIAVSLKSTEEEVPIPKVGEKEWEIVVPTNMQWLLEEAVLPIYNSNL